MFSTSGIDDLYIYIYMYILGHNTEEIHLPDYNRRLTRKPDEYSKTFDLVFINNYYGVSGILCRN